MIRTMPRPGVRKTLGLLAASLLASGIAAASPLDDRIAAFKSAPVQNESEVAAILDTGLKENRSALAFAAAKPWLAANQSDSQPLLFAAAQSAERAGDWQAAASFYRKLLKNPAPDAGIAAEAVPSAYRLLINHLADPEAAYLFMKEDGARLRSFGRARQFDEWFLKQAAERGDLTTSANFLTAIYEDSEAPAHLGALLAEIETFNHGDEKLFDALKKLSAAKRTSAETKARLAWVMATVPAAAKVAELVGAKIEVRDGIYTEPLKAAGELIALMPYEGSILAAKGWMHFNAGDSGVFSRFVNPQREAKVAPILAALAAMPVEQGRKVLWLEVRGGKNRKVKDFLFTKEELQALAAKVPGIMDAPKPEPAVKQQPVVADTTGSRELLDLPENAAPAAVETAFKVVMDRAASAPSPMAVNGLQKVAALPEWSPQVRAMVLSLFRENSPLGDFPTRQGYEQLSLRLTRDFQDQKQWGAIEPYAAGLWQAARNTDDDRHYRGADALAKYAQAALEDGAPSIAMTLARSGVKSRAGVVLAMHTAPNLAQINGMLRQVAGKAAVEVGAVEIPVDESDPAFPIYKSNSEFVQGNTDSAWELYLQNSDKLQPVLRELSVEYGFWLLQRNTETNRTDEAEELVKELTIWSRQAEGTFSMEQEARLKIAYADLAFRKGALPTSRAWYRKVAEAAEYEGTEMQLISALGSVTVDRVSKDFGAAMTELDKLMRMKNPEFRMRVRYARAEVFMDQESYAEALAEIDDVLRQQPKHPDALILRGKIQYEMRKLVEASEIELGPSQDDTVIVPGEAVKINLRDPTLSVSGIGADIEVEIWAKSGDSERVLLYQLGDSKERFRAEVPTALGPPTPGDKVLQILGEDEIRFGYSKRFREKMDDLPADPDLAIGVASDAHLSFSAGAFAPREGERRLDIEELGLSTSQAALGTRAVRPGNPVYLRVSDPDRSLTPGIDEITVSLQASSGDEIRQLVLKETNPFSGEFEAIVPTTGAQALAFASESAPGRDPNMAISSQDYPGWQGEVGDKFAARTFGIDMNDNVPLGKMTIATGGEGQGLTHFVLQTSMNGTDWTTRSRFPKDAAPWDGRPHVSSFPTYRGGMPVSDPESRKLPEDWAEIMELTSARESVAYLSANVTGLSAENLPMVETGHPGYSGLIRYRALFYQPTAAIRRFKLTGYPAANAEGKIQTIFLLDGKPAGEDSEDPLFIERELAPGLHEIQVWRHEGRDSLLKRKPVLLCDEPGKEELVPCPDAMFDPGKFPEGIRAMIPQPAEITKSDAGLDVAFGDKTQARLVRLVIQGFEGVAPTISKLTLTNREGTPLLPVAQDYKALRENTQLEVLPGDQITARYEDPVTATPSRNRHEQRLTVAFNNGAISASFLNYELNEEGERVLVLEPIRRFRFDDAIGIVIDDADLDGSPQRDTIQFTVTSSDGAVATMEAVETEEHSGRFIGRVFPVEGEPSRNSEIRMAKGGTITAVYRDIENLDPGIPADRTVTIGHAQYAVPTLSAYAVGGEELPAPKAEPKQADATTRRTPGPEIVVPRRTLSYTHVVEDIHSGEKIDSLIGAPLRFDVVVPHLALAKSSEIRAYVQTDAARKAAKLEGTGFNVAVPGTLKLTGTLTAEGVEAPPGYTLSGTPTAPTNEPPLEEGRFSFSVPLILGDPPERSFATKDAEDLPSSSLPEGLAVKAGDIIHVGYPWQDEDKEVHWKTATFTVGSHAFLDVMENGYAEMLTSAFVGEKVYLRLIAPGLDKGPDRDVTEVSLKGTGGASAGYQLKETEAHSGVFKGVFTISYADVKPPAKLPPVELNGFPVRYGDDITVSFGEQSSKVTVNKGADGAIEPFSKRFTGDEMAVRTGFTLAECYFELAKKHREMEQESLARREIGQAQKLLAEALATHRDPELKAQAEYLLGNLSQEYADLAKNEESKLPLYQDALARFSKIPGDYPDTEFASKAQFKTALVYEKMGEIENSVEEYVKLAYKYPDDELIPTVMARLGGYFQTKGMAFKKMGDPFREKEDEASQAEVLKYDEMSYPEFLNAAMVFSKLQERFPDDPLAGLSGLRAAQNFMRAHQYEKAIQGFQRVVDKEDYDDKDVRSQALYWMGLSYERTPTSGWRDSGQNTRSAYALYRRVTFDFPDSKWAKYARGRLADPVFARIIQEENKERERMIESLKESQKKRR
ncbi:tetratricopeptide repeat protein [Akkermansiaceae bacterium]|nr:tetratricopeptide repeat protein [Akkermansiaceae bacterium]